MPPACSEALMAQREDGLEVYQTPYDSQVPMVCMDAQPGPFLMESQKAAAPTTVHDDSEECPRYVYQKACTIS